MCPEICSFHMRHFITQGHEFLVQEKEYEMAAISAQRTKFVDEQFDKLQEQERKGREEISNLKKQLKQLTKDFQYNLQLLNDRDTELELLENQVFAHKSTEAKRLQVRTRLTVCLGYIAKDA
jgi:septal ring factor EnvC (AmiA/AmiB activator)